MNGQINNKTSRHIAKAISFLNEVKTPKCAVEAVRREFWFLKDDIMDIVNKGNIKNETRLHQTSQKD